MKAILHIYFKVKNRSGLLGSARLDVDLPFAPSSEMAFEHPVWKDSRRPLTVIYNIEDSSFLLSFSTEELESEDKIQQQKEVYQAHGWKVT